jgi:hypothetical protein
VREPGNEKGREGVREGGDVTKRKKEREWVIQAIFTYHKPCTDGLETTARASGS